MKIDFLEKIYRKELTEKEADRIYNEAIDSQEDIPWWEVLGMNTIEATAYAHGTIFEEIAKWRYEGWPNYCIYCGKKIALWEGGWTVRSKDNKTVIMHIECLQ